MSTPSDVFITFLGGLGDIGRNCAAIEIDGRIMLLDCGLMFPNDDMWGIDLVLPDFSWLIERKDDIEGCVLTHGHEDHIGALRFALEELSFPLIASELTLGLARGRIEEAGLAGRTEFIAVADGERRQFGPFDIEFLPTTHSVPHAFATAWHTPQGTIVHSGDFKIDLTPVDGRLCDLSRLGALASGDGIRLLLSDSTNAEEHGHSRSELAVGAVLYQLMHQNEGRRIITASFASHLHRIQQIADAAMSFGRVIVPLGRSIRKNVDLARKMGVLDIPEASIVDVGKAAEMEPGKVCVISTGSQGEPMSALALLGSNENRWLEIEPTDTVILSSHPIPGNETAVSKVIDNLVRRGAKVVHSGIADVHATGHAKQEELKLFLSITKPEWFVPVHGEYRHLVSHAALGEMMGVQRRRCLVAEDGFRLRLDADGLHREADVAHEYVFVHGVGDVNSSTLADRSILGSEGVVTAVVCVDLDQRTLVGGPVIATRGWVVAEESTELIDAITGRVTTAVQEALGQDGATSRQIEKAVRRAAGSYVGEKTRRRPMIVPIVLVA